jgi:hypothetical protein
MLSPPSTRKAFHVPLLTTRPPTHGLDDAEAKKFFDTAAAVDKRFKYQTAAPGSEAALRRMIEELRVGKPNYDLLSPASVTQHASNCRRVSR